MVVCVQYAFHMNETSEQNRQHYFEEISFSFKKMSHKKWEAGWASLKDALHFSTHYSFLPRILPCWIMLDPKLFAYVWLISPCLILGFLPGLKKRTPHDLPPSMHPHREAGPSGQGSSGSDGNNGKIIGKRWENAVFAASDSGWHRLTHGIPCEKTMGDKGISAILSLNLVLTKILCKLWCFPMFEVSP